MKWNRQQQYNTIIVQGLPKRKIENPREKCVMKAKPADTKSGRKKRREEKIEPKRKSIGERERAKERMRRKLHEIVWTTAFL